MIGNKVNRNPDTELNSCFKHNNWRRRWDTIQDLSIIIGDEDGIRTHACKAH
jgi:hypothetical protein